MDASVGMGVQDVSSQERPACFVPAPGVGDLTKSFILVPGEPVGGEGWAIGFGRPEVRDFLRVTVARDGVGRPDLYPVRPFRQLDSKLEIGVQLFGASDIDSDAP